MSDHRLILTLFGATGDLASRKLYPAMFRLYQNGHISRHFALIGTGRTPWTHEDMRQAVAKSVANEVKDPAQLEEFLTHIYYVSHDVNDTSHYDKLKSFQEQLDQEYQTQGNRVFYISLSPSLFPVITGHLRGQGLITDHGFNRLIIEKPFGNDVASAKELQSQLNLAFDEDQIFRIDHYLGKEMVQAIRNIRFDNPIFANNWNKDGIDNIQISLVEDVGVEDRGEYYDHSGATKDMIQNHALQILALLAMDRPQSDESIAIQEEKIKVLSSLHLPTPQEVKKDFVRGQYGPSDQMKGYRQEEKVDPQSITETYFAGKISLDLPQWEGVPFFVRSGKRLNAKETMIDVFFKGDGPGQVGNHLRIEVAPRTGYRLTINQKVLGYSHETQSIPLEFYYEQDQVKDAPQDYERLILECIQGDKSHFAHYLEVVHAWQFIDRLRQVWQTETPDFPNYPAGSHGPLAADQLLASYGCQWVNL
ncbi:TPA: glucose-6-phosphate dehydrogenase [Streptococcus suis]